MKNGLLYLKKNVFNTYSDITNKKKYGFRH